MTQKIIINSNKYETRVAVLENSKMVEFFLERHKKNYENSGNIYKGRVQRVLPGMQAAFVDIGSHQAAFIHIHDMAQNIQNLLTDSALVSPKVKIQDFICQDNELMVQVLKPPIGTKGAKITTNLSIPGRFLVFLPKSSHIGISKRIEDINERHRLKNIISKSSGSKKVGYIVRTAAKGAGEKELKIEIDFLNDVWFKLQKMYRAASLPSLVHQELHLSLKTVRDLFLEKTTKLIVDSKTVYKSILSFLDTFNPTLKQSIELYNGSEAIFEVYNIEKQINRSLSKKLWLKSGGYIVIEHTEALTAIDINTGRYVGKDDLEQTIMKINLEAVKEVAHQIRLQNIGGIIIIDFIDMEEKNNREKIFNELVNAFLNDRNQTHILPMSDLGLIQMTRKKTNMPMMKILCESCNCCKGRGLHIAKKTIAINIYKEVSRYLDEEMAGCTLKLRVNPDIAEFLRTKKPSLISDLEKTIQAPILIDKDSSYHLELFEISTVAVG